MILYNTLMGVAAGLALILLARLGTTIRSWHEEQAIDLTGWSITLAILGVILTFLGGLMTVTWPLNANPPINIAFGEPNLFFGLLLIGASIYLAIHHHGIKLDQLQKTLAPVAWLIFALGLIMASITLSIVRFTLVGGAPPAEPITGLLSSYPLIENTFFAIIYGLTALGALLFPAAFKSTGKGLWAIVWWSWTIGGFAFFLFSVLNYYTHIGMLYNIQHGTNFAF